jgi:hypothetical protein
MTDADGRTCSEVTITGGLFDLQSRRLIEPTDEWLAALGMT